ncbi:hypothetical protein QR680_011788 [Steinernema hermaphroditum]|uniref:ShKT domain-containing protein n=1 Tax=Steinernema hermaphroditum TaxID=289476 RepID=A0AA39HZQ7_9BILA|nr:hypothetical protein QR680_011788 [Steinernema hermaphroditum]
MSSGKRLVFALLALLVLVAVVSAEGEEQPKDGDGAAPKEGDGTEPKDGAGTDPKEGDGTDPKEEENPKPEEGSEETNTTTTAGPPPPAICSDASGKLLPTATACVDKAPYCNIFTKVGADDASRDPKCYDPAMAPLAKDCANSCGTCCKDPAYSCENTPGSVDCEKMKPFCGYADAPTKRLVKNFCPATCGLCDPAPATDSTCKDNPEFNCPIMDQYCNDFQFKDTMAQNCPVTCKACGQQGGSGSTGVSAGSQDDCRDDAKNCGDFYAWCNREDYAFLKQKCRKTCGVCVARPNGAVDCRDTNKNCQAWQSKHGYCQMAFYSVEHKKTNCRKTCNLCLL